MYLFIYLFIIIEWQVLLYYIQPSYDLRFR